MIDIKDFDRRKSAVENPDRGEHGPNFMKRAAVYLAASVALGAVGLGAYYFLQNHTEETRKKILEENRCELVYSPVFTTSPGRLARDAIRESKDLGKRLGVERLTYIILEKNDGRNPEEGQNYYHYSCGSD